MLSGQCRVFTFLRKNLRNEGTREMATLKAISIRLKSVKNIKKITQSMKMVSAAKLTRAERELKQARPLGQNLISFYQRTEVPDAPPEVVSKRKILYLAVSSDRGLCGGVHAAVSKEIRKDVREPVENVKITCIGDKVRTMLQRSHGESFLFVCQEVGRVSPSFTDASRIVNTILNSDFEYQIIKIVYNRFRSVVSYSTEKMDVFRTELIAESPSLRQYDELDDETLLSFIEFSTAALLFYAMKEGACSEQSSRMTAMDNASKNAGDMIGKLTLQYNRTRQAVITRELIEIISGASAL